MAVLPEEFPALEATDTVQVFVDVQSVGQCPVSGVSCTNRGRLPNWTFRAAPSY